MSDDPGQLGEPESPPPVAIPPPVVMSAPVEPPRAPIMWRSVAIDARGALDEDIICRQCGYNLRGLAVQQACPECGTPVEESVPADLLQFANPEWAGRLKRGLKYIIIGTSTTIGVQVIGAIAILAVFKYQSGLPNPMAGPNPWGQNDIALIENISTVILAASLLVTIIGVWWFTSPESSKPEKRSFNVRTVTRWGYVANILALPARMMIQSDSPALTGPGTGQVGVPGAFEAVVLVSLIAGLASFVAQVTGLVMLRRLFRLMRRPTQVSQALVVVRGYGFFAGVTLAAWLINEVVMRHFVATAVIGPVLVPIGTPVPATDWTSATLTKMFGLGACAGGIGTLAFGIWAIVLLFIAYFAVRNAHTKAAASGAA